MTTEIMLFAQPRDQRWDQLVQHLQLRDNLTIMQTGDKETNVQPLAALGDWALDSG